MPNSFQHPFEIPKLTLNLFQGKVRNDKVGEQLFFIFIYSTIALWKEFSHSFHSQVGKHI